MAGHSPWTRQPPVLDAPAGRTRCYVLSRFSCLQLFMTPWTVARQAPRSMEFSRQEHWSGLPFLPPGNLPDPGVGSKSLMSLALAGGVFTTVPPGKEKQENEALLDLSSKNLPSCSGAESIRGAKTAVNAKGVTYILLRVHQCMKFPWWSNN